MFNLFRSREKSVQIILGAMLVLVAASMLFYLIPGMGAFGNAGDASGEHVLASVGKEQVTDEDLQRRIEMLTQGRSVPKAMLVAYIPRLINQLVEDKAMAYKAKEMGLTISDDELANSIQAEMTQQMGGKFDLERLKAGLQQQGMTVEMFERQRREEMMSARLENLERQAIVISDAEARSEYQRKNLKVGLQYVAFEGKQFISKVNNDPAAIKAYFDKNRGLFRIPEKRSFDLIVGSVADFIQSAEVSDEQLQKDYRDSIDSFRTPERVKARHILVKTQGQPKEDVPKLRAKAEDLLKQIKGGADFAALAKKSSDDTGSAQKGGDLGWVVRGQMVPKFEQACFTLKPGETSGIVETEYGFHIVQVLEKQEAHQQSFEEARPQLLLEAKKQVASQILQKNVDAAHAAIVANASQAQATAAKFGLKYYHQENVTNGSPLPELTNQGSVSSSIFSSAKGAVTEIASLDSQEKAAFAVVTSISPARNAEMNEVQADVMQRYATAESDRLAAEAAKQAADAARKGESLESIAKQYGGAVKTAAPFNVDGAAEGIGSGSQLAAAFKANVGDVIPSVDTGVGHFICKVTEKIPADMNQFAAAKAGIVQGLESERLRIQQPLFRDSVMTELKRRGVVKTNDAEIAHLLERYQG